MMMESMDVGCQFDLYNHILNEAHKRFMHKIVPRSTLLHANKATKNAFNS